MSLIQLEGKFFQFFIFFVLLIAGICFARTYELTKPGTDPTEVRNRLDIGLLDVTGLANRDLIGLSCSGFAAMTEKSGIGMAIPFIYSDFDGWINGGIGDAVIEIKRQFIPQNYTRIYRASAIGTSFFLNTGDYDLGTSLGQYVAAPYFTAVFSPDDEFLFAPILSYYYGYSERSIIHRIKKIRLQCASIINYDNGFWTTLQPGVIFDLTGDYYTSFPMRAEFGKIFNQNWGCSVTFTFYLAGQQRTNYFASLSIRYLF